MVRILGITLSLIAALSTTACATAASQPAQPAKPKSVILVVGDGMGIAHFTAARHLYGAAFAPESMPVTALIDTRSASAHTTDSAAAATALATGIRTTNRYVGVDPQGRPARSALDAAEQSGMATGLVTTANFFDATPAAFAAHETDRYNVRSIVPQMLAKNIEVIAGGGRAKFGADGVPALTEYAALHDYSLIRSREELSSVSGDRLLAVFETEGDESDFPTVPLPVLARWALEKVSPSRDGFFLLLEHEGTDGTSHQNLTDRFLANLRSFNETIAVALEYASTRPDVLVLVTGDHETGGLQLLPEKAGPLELKWTTTGHTGEAVPLFATGRGAERFAGFMDNSEVGRLLIELMTR